MLRRDVDEAVVAAAAHTPFEAAHRVFVLERADTMNDEAANALLKTLEEPPSYVVLLLLTDRPTQVLPTIASRCQPVRFDPPAPRRSPSGCSRSGVGAGDGRGRARGSASATASARSRSRSATGRRCAPPRRRSPARRCTGAPAPSGRGARCSTAPRRRRRGAEEVERALAEELAVPAQEGAQAARDRVHRARPPRRAPRRDRRARCHCLFMPRASAPFEGMARHPRPAYCSAKRPGF